jgi:5-methylcytosine-specific restriction endonuclease McrA
MGLARRGKPTWMKGKKHNAISIEKNRQSHLRKIAWNKGKECPQFSGKNHWNWRGGITKLSISIRRLPQYKEWRERVFSKDKFTCQECKKKGGNLEADHIKPFEQILKENHITTIQMAKKCKQLWEVSNGRTLCIPCHMKTETFPKNLRCATVRPYGKRTVRLTKAN